MTRGDAVACHTLHTMTQRQTARFSPLIQATCRCVLREAPPGTWRRLWRWLCPADSEAGACGQSDVIVNGWK